MSVERYLNIRQRKFADKYLECGNSAEAARFAGYTEKAAKEAGYAVLTNSHVKEYIKKNSENSVWQ
jgi:phage terminase small subunit